MIAYVPQRHRTSRAATLAILAAVLCAPVMLVVGGGSAAAATTTTTTAVADTYSRSDNPTTNYGTLHRLSAVTSTSQTRKAYLRFRVVVPSGQAVSRATLRLYAAGADVGGGVDVRSVADHTWGETTLTWANAPAVGSVVGHVAGFATHTYLSVDVSGAVTAGSVDLAITTSAGTAQSFSSREDQRRPQLVVETTPTTAPPGTPNATTPCGTTTTAPTYQHVVWIVMENKNYSSIIGSSSAPYINGLGTKCGIATSFYAEAHPSLPNYIAMTSGGTQGVTDDNGPSSHPLTAPSIFSQLGTGWRSLEEAMPSACALASSGTYAVKHNPAAYYTNVRTACATQDVALASTPDVSARYTFVTPDLCHDMHDCSVQTGDTWLSTFLPKVLNSPQYTAGTTAVFLTWDEDDFSTTNNQHVATLVIAPSVVGGSRVSTTFNHYSMLRTTEELLGLSLLGNAATATSMRTGFHL